MVQPKTNGLAIAAFVLSIPLGALGGVAAVPMGFVARSQIKKSNGMQKGAGLALAAIIIGFVWIGLFAVFLLVAAVSSSTTNGGPALSDLTSQVQSQITGTGANGFGVSGVDSVVCNPPSNWQPAAKFTCFAYDSTKTEVGEYDGIVEPNAANGDYRWNAHWIAAG